MIKKKSIILGFALATIVSCQSIETPISNHQPYAEEVLVPRRTNAPIVLSLPIDENSLRSVGDISQEGPLIGNTYDIEGGLPHSPSCVRRFLFDSEVFDNLGADNFLIQDIKESTTHAFSFASERSLVENIKNTFVSGIDASVKVAGFTLGFKNTIKRVFSQQSVFTSHNAYAWIGMIYNYKRYRFIGDDQILDDLKWRGLSSQFRQRLYGASLFDVFGRYAYGRGVILDHNRGAKAEVLYSAFRRKQSKEETLEKEMNFVLGIGFEDNSTNIKSSFTKRRSNIIPIPQNGNSSFFQSIRVSTRTCGGTASMPFTNPMNLKDANLNFGPWLSSLNNPKDYVLTELNRLESVSRFLIEENFKQRVERNILNKSFTEPKIYISNHHIDDVSESIFTNSYKIYVTLVTRYGDQIMLRPMFEDDDNWWTFKDEDEFKAKATLLAMRLKLRYALPIVQRFYNEEAIKPYSRGFNDNWFTPSVRIPLYGMDETKMTKFHHDKYGIDFLVYDEGPKRRYAFALYDKQFVGTYGLEAIYEKAPINTKYTDRLPDDFVIIGL